MDVDPVARTLIRAWQVLEPLEVPMAVVGGIALAAWGRPRFTQDVDLLLAPRESEQDAVLARLLDAGFRQTKDARWMQLGGIQLMPLSYEPPGSFLDLRLDLLVARSKYHLGVLERSVPFELPATNRTIEVASCEDMLILKMLAGRIIDRSDAAMLLRSNRDRLDLEYLMKWIEELELQSSLAEIWDEAFPGERPPE